jgi:hypothetical protein
MKAASALALALVAAVGCGSPPPPAPSAVIIADPPSVCFGDDYATGIRLDGSRSTPHLSLVYSRPDPSEGQLTFAWSFEGSAYQVDPNSDPGSATMVVTMAADRPLHVRLRVTNAEGGVTEALTTIAVTFSVPDAGADSGLTAPCPVR